MISTHKLRRRPIPTDSTPSLLAAVVAGDADAWQRLAAAIRPQIEAIARSHSELRQRGMHQSPDDVSELVTASLERLARQDHRNLRQFLEQHERNTAQGTKPQSFDSWLYGAVDYTIQDHLRKRYGRKSRANQLTDNVPRPSKRDINSYAGELEEERFDATYLRQLGITVRLTVAQIMDHIRSEFSAPEVDAMHRYYECDQSFEEIAHALNLGGAEEANKLIRRLNARLRHKFGADG